MRHKKCKISEFMRSTFWVKVWSRTWCDIGGAARCNRSSTQPNRSSTQSSYTRLQSLPETSTPQNTVHHVCTDRAPGNEALPRRCSRSSPPRIRSRWSRFWAPLCLEPLTPYHLPVGGSHPKPATSPISDRKCRSGEQFGQNFNLGAVLSQKHPPWGHVRRSTLHP
jgi:hypothetical protein